MENKKHSPALNLQEQLDNLKAKQLLIGDDAAALKFLDEVP